MNPRKYPRTMQEAFGPYTDDRLEEQDYPIETGWQEIVVVIASLIAFWALVALAVWPS